MVYLKEKKANFSYDQYNKLDDQTKAHQHSNNLETAVDTCSPHDLEISNIKTFKRLTRSGSAEILCVPDSSKCFLSLKINSFRK